MCKTPLSMGFPKQEYWRGLPFLYPGELSTTPATSPALQVDSLLLSHQGSPILLEGAFKISVVTPPTISHTWDIHLYKATCFSVIKMLLSLFLPLQYSTKALLNSLSKASIQAHLTRDCLHHWSAQATSMIKTNLSKNQKLKHICSTPALPLITWFQLGLLFTFLRYIYKISSL